MIAVDAMGGDFAPHEIVKGALQAAKKGVPVTLFGDYIELTQHLRSLDPTWEKYPLSLAHCTQKIEMDDVPTKATLAKKDSSLVRAMNAVVEGKAGAIVTAGNSGAALVAGTMLFGRLDNVLRPAVGDFLPSNRGTVFCLDLGVNSDCRPEYLEQFALMGHAYVQLIKKIERPRVALLSNGHEPYKGSTLVKESFDCLKSLPINFVGNIEPRDLFKDQIDVLVCDGFSGNIMIKTMEGVVQVMENWLQENEKHSWWRSLAKHLWGKRKKPLFQKHCDFTQRPGALLFGLKHPLLLAHGCSSAQEIEESILFAHRVVQEKILQNFNERFAQLIAVPAGSAGATPQEVQRS